MAMLKKSRPGAAPGGHVWAGPDDVVDVPDVLAAELLAIPDGGFSEVLPGAGEQPAGDETPAEDENADPARTPVTEPDPDASGPAADAGKPAKK